MGAHEFKGQTERGRSGWKSDACGATLAWMRLILIIFVIAAEGLIRLLVPRANGHSRLPIEEPKRSGRRGDGSASGIPAIPDRPLSMSGGAAASMHFDE